MASLEFKANLEHQSKIKAMETALVLDIDILLCAKLLKLLRGEGTAWSIVQCHGSSSVDKRSISLPTHSFNIKLVEEHELDTFKSRTTEGVTLGVWFKSDTITKEAMKRAFELANGRCIIIRTETDLLDILRAKVRQRQPSLAEQVALLTWRQQGLPPEAVQCLCAQYSTLSALIEGMSQPQTSFSLDTSEISAILGQDYYVE